MTRSKVLDRLAAFADDDSGTTAVEYGLIASGIFLAIIAVVYQLGGEVTNDFQNISDAFN